MKRRVLTIIGLMGALILSQNSVAQENLASHSITLGLPEVALLTTQSPGINLTLSAAVIAGEAVLSEKSDSSAYIQFSSVISEATPRTLSAKYTGTLPAGTVLEAKALAPNANTSGDYGTLVATDVVLAATDNILVSAIGSCYSGTASDDGYRLKYTWGLDNPESNYADIKATSSASITVVLTMTAAN